MTQQLTYMSLTWGETFFIPVSKNENTKKCKRCLFYRNAVDCARAPCMPREREDGKTGYFSIHQMPTERTKPDDFDNI